MRVIRLALLVVILSLVLNQVPRVTADRPVPGSARSNRPSPTLSEESKAVWRQFRDTFPLHIQTLAFDKQSRTLIISEPPPHVTLASLKEALQLYNPTLSPSMHVEQMTVGVDGWVKDIVIPLPRMDDAQTRDALDAVQQHVYHTTYKAQVLSLPAAKPAVDNSKLDLSVTASEIEKWLFKDDERFSPVLGGPAQSANDLLIQKKQGVFFSRDRGLVLWSIDRNKPIDADVTEARLFALDADIIIGAVASGDHLLILGRERIVPVSVLPPLRTETIVLLASVNDDELAQSYERNNIFAGKFKGTKDWAPIYLSDALIDTEYGSLLNITDQLLKRWSMNGLINYDNFKYSDPQSWGKPWCFNKPLSEESGSQSLTFNWNTQGVGYTTTVAGRDFFSLNRTGSLPTSYLEGDDQKATYTDYEEKGYQCFATFGDPNLARVVQYAALYQLFQKFPVKNRVSQNPPGQLILPNDALSVEALRIVNLILRPNGEQLQRINTVLGLIGSGAEEVFTQLRAVFSEVHSKSGETGLKDLAARIAHPRVSKSEFARARSIQQKLRNLTPAQQQRLLNPLTLSAADVRLFAERQELIRWVAALEAYEKFAAVPPSVSKALFMLIGRPDLDDLRDRYSKQFKPEKDAWIHTPSIVVSQALGVLEGGTGGHNVDAATTRFEVALSVPRGTIRTRLVNNRLTFSVNPQDAGKIPSLVRRAALLSEKGQLTPQRQVQIRQSLQQLMNSAPPPPPPRVRNTAILNPAEPPPGRGLNVAEGSGWQTEKLAVAIPEEARSSARYGDVAVLVDRIPRAEGFEYVITSADGRAIKAYSTPSAVDAIVALGRNAPKANPKVAFHLKGFSEGEAQALLFNTNLRLKSGSLTGVAERGSAFHSKAADYKLPQVTVGEHTLRQIPEGRYKGLFELQVSFDVPSQAVAKPPLTMKLQMFYRNAVSNPTVTGLKAAIRSFFNKPISFDASMNTIILDLANELRATNPGAKSVLTISEKDTGGIFILELHIPRKDDRNIREGNHAS